MPNTLFALSFPGRGPYRRNRIFFHSGLTLLVACTFCAASVAQSNVVSLREDVTVTRLHDVPLDAVKIAYDPVSDALLYLTRGGDIYRHDLSTEQFTRIATFADHQVPETRGLLISVDEQIYLLGNRQEGTTNAGVVRRASIQAEALTGWTTVMTTDAYPRSLTAFDHLINGFAVSPDGRYLFIASGSRTDHGEVEDAGGLYPGLRETALTTVMLRIPADTTDLVIPNDSAALDESGFRFATGFRNAFDLEWGPNGHLFGTENSGDRDDPEELNWIHEGGHYGFPWRIGGNDTPQRFEDYDPDADPLLGNAIQPVFSNDPTYPEPPEGVNFVEPLLNVGPDADIFRDALDGSVQDASDLGLAISTFTPHRSPLGLVFDTAGVLAEPYTGQGFVLCWTGSNNPLLGPLGDPGRDLLHLALTWSEEDSSYSISATKIAEGFIRSIDAVLVGTSLYTLGMGFSPADAPSLWRFDFPRRSGSSSENRALDVPSITGLEIFPNPISSSGRMQLTAGSTGFLRISLYDVTGRQVMDIERGYFPAGRHVIPFSLEGLSPGVYVARLQLEGFSTFQPIIRVDQ